MQHRRANALGSTLVLCGSVSLHQKNSALVLQSWDRIRNTTEVLTSCEFRRTTYGCSMSLRVT